MCMQDIRIGQSLAAQQHTTGVPTIATPLLLLTPDPNRARIVAGSFGWLNAGTSPVVLRADGATGPVIGSLGQAAPATLLTVESHGTLILGAVWATVVVDNAVTVDVSDLVLTPRSADA